ncbi:MAG: pentapeptide repeat-containing protein [Cyanobacteria bacterium Co-bin8]|nr:pentapeptide repeat-containing protein [Cyanobacteria bacterium Co-bin8]
MAHTAQRQTSSTQTGTATALVVATKPTLGLRRLVAWALEVSLLVGSAALPWAIGEAVRQTTDSGVPLNPAVSRVEGAIARTLNLPKQPRLTQVPPLTNLLWFSALGLPLVLAGSQLYWLASTGKTLPKHWLGLRVVTRDGSPPGGLRTLQRELGRWGLPLVAAYGLWFGSGAFPHMGLLGLLAGLALAAEGGTGWLNRARRPWHDLLAGTRVVAAGVYFPVKRLATDSYREVTVSAYSAEPFYGSALPYAEPEGGVSSVVLLPSGRRPPGRGQWVRQYPVLVLGGLVLGGLSILMVGIVGTQIYTQQQVNQRSSQQQTDDLFLALVDTLSTRASRPEEQQAAILALASTQDSRAIPLLVDLLSQAQAPQVLEALQQGLVTLGPETLPHLQRLNQSLANDIAALPPDQRLISQQRQQTVKRTLAKLLTLYSGQLQGTQLSRTYLGKVVESPDAFTLVLDQVDLAGVVWQGSILSGASFRQAHFFAAGPDQRPDTYDDWVADLSGSDLTEADFSGARLRYVLLQGSSLLRATLSGSEAAFADFSEANLSSAQLISANLSQTLLVNASLVGADLTESNLSRANLTAARLHQAQGTGANLEGANLTRVEGREANLSNANLSGATLTQADLSDSQLAGANFSGANLENARLHRTNLQAANFRGANLSGTDFQDAVFSSPTALAPDSFIESLPNSQPQETLTSVDFSRAQNLAPEQIAYICRQGGIHPVCPLNP